MRKTGCVLIFLIFLVALCSTACTQASQTIYSGGKACLPGECPQGSVAVLTIRLIWKDLDASQGGTGRKIVEEAVFIGKEGEKEIKFANVRISPFFPRGEISIDAKCEFKKGETVLAEFRMDKEDEDNPRPLGYNEAAAGRMLDLKLKLRPADKE